MGGAAYRASTSDRVPLPPHSSRAHPRFRALLRSFPNSSLPPSRGEVRWGVGGCERPPAIEYPSRPTPPERIHASVSPLRPFRTPLRSLRIHSYAPSVHSCAPSLVIPAQAGTHRAPRRLRSAAIGGGAEAALVGCRDAGAHTGGGGRLVPACAGMTMERAGMTRGRREARLLLGQRND